MPTLAVDRYNFTHTHMQISFTFPFPVSPWCWRFALIAFGSFPIEHDNAHVILGNQLGKPVCIQFLVG